MIKESRHVFIQSGVKAFLIAVSNVSVLSLVLVVIVFDLGFLTSIPVWIYLLSSLILGLMGILFGRIVAVDCLSKSGNVLFMSIGGLFVTILSASLVVSAILFYSIGIRFTAELSPANLISTVFMDSIVFMLFNILPIFLIGILLGIYLRSLRKRLLDIEADL